jgi:hypothetical protein
MVSSKILVNMFNEYLTFLSLITKKKFNRDDGFRNAEYSSVSCLDVIKYFSAHLEK